MRWIALSLALVVSASCCCTQWSQTAQQIPDYQSLPDRTEELQKRLDEANGQLNLVDKQYRITRPLIVDLTRHGAASIRSVAATTLIMDGPGPAYRVGDHQGTASPIVSPGDLEPANAIDRRL